MQETAFDVVAIAAARAVNAMLNVAENVAIDHSVARAYLDPISYCVVRRGFLSILIGHAIADQTRVYDNNAVTLVRARGAIIDGAVISSLDSIAIVLRRGAVLDRAAVAGLNAAACISLDGAIFDGGIRAGLDSEGRVEGRSAADNRGGRTRADAAAGIVRHHTMREHAALAARDALRDRKSTRLNSSHLVI